jgi:CHASE3 domain sensor protein
LTTTATERLEKQQRQNVFARGGAVLSVLIMLALLVFAYRDLAGYVEQYQAIRHSHEVIRELEQVLSIVKDAETGARGYLLSNDTTFLQPYDQAVGTLAAHFTRLEELLSSDTSSRNGLYQMREQIQQRMGFLERVIGDQRSGRAPNAADHG